MCIRWFTDRLAALMFLCKGAPRNARSVIQARQAFRQYKKGHKDLRAPGGLPDALPASVYKKSLLVAFYLRGKNFFSQL
jgi:hypothetical protein